MENIGKIKITEENPVGENLKFDDVYLELKSEISKETALTLNTEIDYNKIETLSIDILKNKSKDLSVAIYLSSVYIQNDDLENILKSFVIISDILTEFDNNYYPLKNIARYNILSWWLNKINLFLEQDKITEIEIEKTSYYDYYKHLKNIDAYIQSNLDEPLHTSDLFTLFNTKISISNAETNTNTNTNTIQETKQETPQEESQDSTETSEQQSPLPENNATEEKGTNPPSTQQTVQQEPQQISNEIDIIELQKRNSVEELLNSSTQNIDFDFVLHNTLGDLSKISINMIENKNYNVFIFILDRIKIWGKIENIPPNDKNITYINAPETYEFDFLNSLYNNQDWHNLLLEAEKKVFSNIFWLDLHFYVYVSLKNLNNQNLNLYLSFIKSFLLNLKKLSTLKFSNSVNFANHSTQIWLENLLENENAKNSAQRKDYKKECQKGYELLSDNKIQDSIKFFLQKIEQETSKPDKIEYILLLINILGPHKYNDLINVYLDYLLKMVEEHKLYDWDKDLCIKIYNCLLQTYHVTNYPVSDDMLAHIKKQIAFMDIDQYIQLTQEINSESQ